MINSRFSVAIHILMVIATMKDHHQLTSELIAGSVNTNPVVVRRTIGLLKRAGIVASTPGVAGYTLMCEPKDITLFQIYEAIGGPTVLFSVHENPNPACAIGQQITTILEHEYDEIWNLMKKQLKGRTLETILEQLK